MLRGGLGVYQGEEERRKIGGWNKLIRLLDWDKMEVDGVV